MKCTRCIVSIITIALGMALAGCGSSPYRPSGDHLLDLRNPALAASQRVDAARGAWAQVLDGSRDRARTRRSLKDLAWSRSTALELRQATVGLLLSDPDPAGEADAKLLAQLMLPNESELSIVAELCGAAVSRGWMDLVPAIVRSYSRIMPGVADDERPEAIALAKLHPGTPLQDIVFGVFIDPGHMPGGAAGAAALRWEDRTRSDSWELLSRLDPTGSNRRGLIMTGGANGQSAPGSDHLAMLRKGLAELGCLPDTAMELEWLASLSGASDERGAALNQVWWAQASKAVASLGDAQRAGLKLRHIEPIRWASLNRASLLTMDRAVLHDLAAATLSDRPRHRRTAEKSASRAVGKERLRDWDDQMSWADLLTLLVTDEAVRTGALAATVFAHVEIDREDFSTEYGGVIEAVKASDAAAFRAVLFRPRARDRQSDNRFVASEDMIAYSDRALVHYHQQVQREHNAKFAGPSDADLEYAARSGRTCVVFTSINSRTLNVDYYQPDGVVIDLGVLRRP